VITAEAHQLPAFFESGYTLYLSRVEQYVPALEPLARKMEIDLGLRHEDVYFEAFVSQGAGSAVHFDPNVTINLQLIGSKRWWVAENRHLVNPHLGWSVGTEVDEQMESYSRQPFPTRMPPGSRSFEARPGTLVYLHPGYWHSTANHEPSLSLLYTINPPPWTELLVDEVRKHLQTIDDSRELAFGLGSTQGGEEKRRRLGALIQAIGEVANRLRADELLAKWGGSLSAQFEANGRRRVRARVTGNGSDRRLVLTTRSRGKKKTIELPLEARSAMAWIVARRRPFYGHEMASGSDCSSLATATEILGELEAAGVVRKRPTAGPAPS
jgi:50S ribosomal protein L16 3-hydroxylase